MKKVLSLLVVTATGLFANTAQAQTCIGTCGTMSPNGVVTAPPAYGPDYQYVSTDGGLAGFGQIAGVGGSTGSEFLTQNFAAASGDALQFYFNYVTSDGSGYSDYGFAELLSAGSHVAWLFTARTTTSGDTSPGFGLPANDSTLTPGATPIMLGTQWAGLGNDSGACYEGQGSGCGNTGWIASNYVIGSAGQYALRFGVTNVSDSAYDSGLAFAGLTINSAPVGGVPEPATWALMILGFGATGAALRSRRQKISVRYAAA